MSFMAFAAVYIYMRLCSPNRQLHRSNYNYEFVATHESCICSVKEILV
uniref:Secreted protein n=1 Tax=Ascaris lumbricoides TaxID=6252 RepID=A0A0M3IX53_ASCLU